MLLNAGKMPKLRVRSIGHTVGHACKCSELQPQPTKCPFDWQKPNFRMPINTSINDEKQPNRQFPVPYHFLALTLAKKYFCFGSQLIRPSRTPLCYENHHPAYTHTHTHTYERLIFSCVVFDLCPSTVPKITNTNKSIRTHTKTLVEL